jgi:hypothetical protein
MSASGVKRTCRFALVPQVRTSVSAHGGKTFLGFCFRQSHWLRRQLKYGCLLTAAQLCQEDNAPIRKFERIMVRPLGVLIYLSEDCRRVS